MSKEDGIKESRTSGVLLVMVNNSVFWKISRFTFIVHKLCVVISVDMLSHGKCTNLIISICHL